MIYNFKVTENTQRPAGSGAKSGYALYAAQRGIAQEGAPERSRKNNFE